MQTMSFSNSTSQTLILITSSLAISNPTPINANIIIAAKSCIEGLKTHLVFKGCLICKGSNYNPHMPSPTPTSPC